MPAPSRNRASSKARSSARQRQHFVICAQVQSRFGYPAAGTEPHSQSVEGAQKRLSVRPNGRPALPRSR
jgi:hypothetical protein